MVTLTVSLTGIQHAYSQATPGAAEYLSKMAQATNALNNETWQYLKAVTQGRGAKKVEKTRQALLSRINSVQDEVQSMPGFNGDHTLNHACLEFLTLSYTVLKEDFDKILDMEEIAEESFDLMEAYLNAKARASDMLEDAADDFLDVQEEFVDEHGLTLVESEDKTTQKIKRAGDALKYYNTLFLMFFKCYKEEGYVLGALALGDTVATRKHAGNLGQFASDGLIKLDTIRAYHSDVSLKNTLKRVLDFYKKEAKDFSLMMDFHIKKDKLDKSKSKLDAIKERDRTTSDVAEHNNAVAAYNKSAETYNRLSSSLNDTRKQQVQAWEKAVSSFFSRHSG